ncbi:MAG: hypothetical protein KGK15_14405 [Burkholderiales bacterium]|nr:hypothetical protein [Burkholderiales bacterium]MDE2289447.1 hypothetical protein [Burkholderiales bacterium]MDE2608817.1 hypothetical protein [Burkholderiales bacterium]
MAQTLNPSNHTFDFHCRGVGVPQAARNSMLAHLDALGLRDDVRVTDASGAQLVVALSEERAAAWAPFGDTTSLARKLGLDPIGKPEDLERETLLAMLAAPRVCGFNYPSFEEFLAAVRVRCHIASAARRTQLAFDTVEAERPADCWTYDEERGFTILPGKSLITSLQKATQPDVSGKLYSFSCYRATEYVILLGIAQTLAEINPPLLDRLQRQWQAKAVMSGPFHDVFLVEFGAMNDPLPPGYYVPGDRLWFRNPDEPSSNVPGYEGSWVFYLGGGEFSNFWKRDQHYTLTTKCVEIYHWRHGAYRDAAGQWQMDESVVEARMRETLADPDEVERVLQQVFRLRDPQGVYAEGGCIDSSRECPRRLCPATSDIVLPDVA